jgi:(p)ppGpp synthase/HD superfamily hydrolase
MDKSPEDFSKVILPKEEKRVSMDSRLDQVGIDFSEEKYQYSKELLDRFQKEISQRFDKDNQERIEDGLILMLNVHRDQGPTPLGRPYITHTLEVALNVMDFSLTNDADLVISGLLHDAVEDQPIKLAKERLAQKYGKVIRKAPLDMLMQRYGSEIEELALEEIEKRYGQRVKSAVRLLTNPNFEDLLMEKGVDPNDRDEYRRQRNLLYQEHVLKEIQDPDALVVKLSDYFQIVTSLTQMPHSTPKEKSTIKRYLDKYHPVLEGYIKRLANPNLPCLVKNKEQILEQLKQAFEKLKI